MGSEMCIRDRSYVIKTDSGKEYIRGRRFLRSVKSNPDQTAISRRLHINMPRQAKYRDTEERLEHYDNLRRWDNTLEILPFTTSLREICDIQHFYNGLPVASYMCIPRQEGDDKTTDSPTINNQGGLHLFSLTGGGASVIPVVIVGGIVMWLVWKGYRAFQQYETRKEARGPKKFRDLLRQQGEHLSSSGDSDDSNGDGLRQGQKKKKQVRFHDDDLHSDAWLTRQEKQDREEFIEHLKLLRRQRHRQAKEEMKEDKMMTSGPRHLHLSDSHNVTTTQVHVHRPVQTEVHQHLHLPTPPISTTEGPSTRQTATTTRNNGTISRRFQAPDTLHLTAAELPNSRTSPSHACSGEVSRFTFQMFRFLC